MKNIFTKISASVLWAAMGLGAPAWAADSYEPDDSSGQARQLLLHKAPPALRDTDPTGKVSGIDVDFMTMNAFPGHSYEILLERLTTNFAAIGFERLGFDGTTLLQSGVDARRVGVSTASDAASGAFVSLKSAYFLRWIEPNPSVSSFIRVTGQALNETYTVQLRETTLYCSRYNNTGTQASVILIHRANPDDMGIATPICTVQVGFYAGDPTSSAPGTLAGSVTQDVGHANTWTLAAASIPGVPGTRGAVRIAHTCGWDGLAAKIVSLEPATGFTFDTQCSVRGQ